MTTISEHVKYLVNQNLVKELGDPLSLKNKINDYKLNSQDERITALHNEMMELIRQRIVQDPTFQDLKQKYQTEFSKDSNIVKDPVSMHTYTIFSKVEEAVKDLFPEQPELPSSWPGVRGMIASALQIFG